MKNFLIQVTRYLLLLKKSIKKIVVRVSCITKYDLIEKEHKKSFGNQHQDKIFYIIRRQPLGAGLLSNFHWVMNHIIYAIENDYIPIVNMKNYKTYYNEKIPIEIGNIKTLNAWEYYFEQPCGYYLKDIKKAKNVILGVLNIYSITDPLELYDKNENIIKQYNNVVSNFMKFNQKTLEHLVKTKNTLFNGKKNILGVLYRGTDMKTAPLHYTPPSLEETVMKTLEVVKNENFDHIFIRTEEQEAIDIFEKTFDKSKLIISNINRLKNYATGNIAVINYKNTNSVYTDGLDYLTEIYLLSQCDGIIAQKVNGTNFALGLNNNKYRYIYIFDHGRNI